jgi:hypothetical protein
MWWLRQIYRKIVRPEPYTAETRRDPVVDKEMCYQDPGDTGRY